MIALLTRGKTGAQGLWPTPEEATMLRAAVRRDAAGLAAWTEVEPRLDFETLDGEVVRLLPLLYQNLTAQGVPYEQMGRLKGMYRQAWYRNQLLMAELDKVLTTLHGERIFTILLKGAALAPFYYRDHGVRPMGDIDVLVPVEDARAAAESLMATGWIPLELVDRALRLHSLPMRNAAGHNLDLHWHLGDRLRMPNSEHAARAFIERAVPVELHGIATHILAPDDLLFHVCVHGVRADGDARLRWPVDAITILREAGDTLDWARFLATARQWRFVPVLRDALRYVVDTLDAPAPPWVLFELEAEQLSVRERLGYRLYARHYGYGRGRSVPMLLGEFLRWSSALPPAQAALSLPAFLQQHFGIEHRWELPLLLSFEFRNRGRQPEEVRGRSSVAAR